MATFDPDAFLAQSAPAAPAAGGFDPDAFLAQSKTAAQPQPTYDPTEGMSTFDKAAAGAGKAMYDIGRGAGQMLGLVSRDDIAESRRLDAPLMKTGAGIAGNLATNAGLLAGTALIPGANTVAGAGVIGATTGLLQPSASTGETLSNIALGGAGGAAGQAIANKLPGLVRGVADRSRQAAAQQTADTAQKFAAARRANELGYVTPPAELNPGVISELLSGLSGKVKTAQVFSQKNQALTNSLAKKTLGVTGDVPLNVDTLNAIRQNAGKAYEAVATLGSITPTAAYTNAIDDAIKPFTSSAASFPGRRVPAAVENIKALKTGAFDAGDAINTIKVLRDDADAAYRAGSKIEGKAYKDAAAALEDAIDTHMVSSGAPADLLKNYREARKTIAKTYTVQKSLNPQTGDVAANKLASELARGKPLSGELADIARTAQAFPKSMQSLTEAPKNLSPLDFAVGAGLAGGSMNPLMLASIGARPLARQALLSNAAQKAMLNPGFRQSTSSRAAQALLDNQLVPLLGGTAGTITGLGAANLTQ